MAQGGLITGLAAIEARMAAQNQDFDDSPKARWVKLNDGQSVRINFLQEFNEDDPGFTTKAGTLFLAVEHSSPANFRKKCKCTSDDGRCVGCEMNKKEPKTGWNQKSRLYCNVLVNDGKEDPYVAILSQGLGPKGVAGDMIEYAKIYKTLTDRVYRLKRTGKDMNNTSYSLIALPDGEPVNADDYELYNLEDTVTRSVPYEEQSAFFELTAAEDAPASSPEIEW
jgi:hypothetical protein